MYCKNCKKKVEEGNFCVFCGNRLSEDNEMKKSKDILKIIINILSFIFIIYVVFIAPIYAGFKAPDVVGGWYLIIGPPLFFIFYCIPIMVAIVILNIKPKNVIFNIITCILYFIASLNLLYGGDFIGPDKDEIISIPSNILHVINIFSIIHCIRSFKK